MTFRRMAIGFLLASTYYSVGVMISLNECIDVSRSMLPAYRKKKKKKKKKKKENVGNVEIAIVDPMEDELRRKGEGEVI